LREKQISTQAKVMGCITGQACFQTDVLSFDALFVLAISFVRIDVILCQG
jgi:hypothetical protein